MAGICGKDSDVTECNKNIIFQLTFRSLRYQNTLKRDQINKQRQKHCKILHIHTEAAYKVTNTWCFVLYF